MKAKSKLTGESYTANLLLTKSGRDALISRDIKGIKKSASMVKHLTVKTHKRSELIDITPSVRKLVANSNVKEGVCFLYVPHTTAGVTINEGADPEVVTDLMNKLNDLVPLNGGYLHSEGNSDAHIKASLIGASASVIVEKGALILGTWQSIFFCEFDGPRERKVVVNILGA